MARSAQSLQVATRTVILIARVIWPGLRIMLLPILPVLFALGCLFVLGALGSLYLDEGFHEIGNARAAAGTVEDAWIFGTLAAVCFWLRRVLWRGRLSR